MSQPDTICYRVEEIDETYGQLMCDIVIDGKLELTWSVGSPAPLETVRDFEHTIRLTSAAQ
jgi:hypothetical protein